MTSPRSRARRDLDEQLALSVEEISKIYSDVHETRYRPAVSIYAQLRERRGGAGGSLPPGRPDLEDDADEDDDDEDEPFEEELGAPLESVSFDVRRGEAVGIVGNPESAARTVARILCGMTAPTSGRILVRGRVAPSVELAIALTRRESTAPAVARRLAGLAGPRRRERGDFVRSALVLALGEGSSHVTAAQPPKEILRRVAVAAAFDPTADVLVIDALPDYGDPDLPRRCRERLEQRLAAGAAAIVTTGDLELIAELCSRVVMLDEGRAVRIGATEQILHELAESRDPSEGEESEESELEVPSSAGRTSTKPRLVAFDEFSALMPVSLTDEAGSPRETVRPDEAISLRIAFETATTASVMVVVRFMGDAAHTFTHTAELAEGAYAATLRLVPGALPHGEYSIDAGLVLEHAGLRTKVGRRPAGRLSVEAEAGDDPVVLAAETGSSLPPAGEPGEVEWTLESAGPE